jgi:acyl-CoA thioester hydrolase
MSIREQATRLELSSYPFAFDLRLTYADVDTFQHLNNVAISRFFEEGRATMNMDLFGEGAVLRPSGGEQLLFAAVSIEYLRQGVYPGVVQVGSGIGEIRRSSYLQAGGLFQDGACLAVCDAVTVNAVDGKPTPLQAAFRERAEPWMMKA